MGRKHTSCSGLPGSEEGAPVVGGEDNNFYKVNHLLTVLQVNLTKYYFFIASKDWSKASIVLSISSSLLLMMCSFKRTWS